MLYHYTDRVTAGEITLSKRLRPYPTTLYKDAMAKGPSFVTQPIIWLTINPVIEPVVAIKLHHAGWDIQKDIRRFVFPDTLTDQSLPEYADKHGIDTDWFAWMVRTGEMAGSHYTTWRVYEADLTRWLRVEKIKHIEPNGQIHWKPA